MSFSPAKLKIDELAYWCIERDGSASHSGILAREYNFQGIISIIPRIKATITEFYLELPLGDSQVLRIDETDYTSKISPKIISDEPIVYICSFQKRLPYLQSINVPSYGYVIMKFNRGKANQKVKIKLNPEYRWQFLKGHPDA